MEDKELEQEQTENGKVETVTQEAVSEPSAEEISADIVNQQAEEQAVTEEQVAVKVHKKPKKEKAKKEKAKKEKVASVDEYAGLSDDEIYTKLQTEKLVKRKKNRRIATLIGMCFALALAVCIIVLAIVPISMKPASVSEGFATVKLHNGKYNPESVSYQEGSDGFAEFMEYYNKSFEQTCLSALFNGSLTSVKYEESIESGKTAADKFGTTGELNSNGVVYLELNFDEKQEIDYTSGRANRYWDGKLTFTKAYVVVNSEEGVKETQIYLVVNYPTFDKDGVQTGVVAKGPYLVTITVKANTNVIYDAWKAGDLFK